MNKESALRRDWRLFSHVPTPLSVLGFVQSYLPEAGEMYEILPDVSQRPRRFATAEGAASEVTSL